MNIQIDLYGYSVALIGSNTTPFFVLALIVVAYSALSKDVTDNKYPSLLTATFAIVLLITVPFLFVEKSFGNSELSAIIISLKHNSAEKLVKVGIEDFKSSIIEISALTVLSVLAARHLLKSVRYFPYILAPVILALVANNPLLIGIYDQLTPNPAHAKIAFHSEFAPVNIEQRPERQKNLIHIYLESLERTYQATPSGAEAFGYFSQLEKDNISFTNIVQASGTGTTAGGILASQCGVPMMSNGMIDFHSEQNYDAIAGLGVQKFMPGVTCLGDILSSEGYFLSYMNGSDLSFYSKGLIFSTHGYDQVFGSNSLSNFENELRKNGWGLDDDYIFEKASNDLEMLSAMDRPFVLTMLTLATHGPDGVLDDNCVVEDGSLSRMPAAIMCTSRHIERLLNKIEQLGLSEETIVVVQSDHLAMKNTISDELDNNAPDRRNLVIVIDGKKTESFDKLGTMFDVFPTLLELLGYKISDHAASLGRSLLTNQPTLAEKYSVSVFSSAVANNPELQSIIWAPEGEDP